MSDSNEYDQSAEVEDGAPTAWHKYDFYSLAIDPNEDEKAKEVLLCNFDRPHMRAFHFSWWGFFMAFFIWFSIVPLLPTIKEDLGLTDQDLWTSTIASVAGNVVFRSVLGPLCDKYGPRAIMTSVLCLAAIPTAMTGVIQSSTDLIIVRSVIGLAGGSFVVCQYWTSSMFSKEVVGTANAMVAGWGNLGGGVTQIIVGSLLFPLFRAMCGDNSELAWRTVCIVPAIITFATGVAIYFFSDDTPKGNFTELSKHGHLRPVVMAKSFWSGLYNHNTWILAFQYGCCFGVELTMNHAVLLYFKDEFGQTTDSASAIASIFGWMNLFARAMGGIASDKMHTVKGMRGRIQLQALLLAGEGVSVLIFSQTKSLAGAIIILVVFSLFVQAAEGSSYGIVPYIDRTYTGSVSGLVGAGGNVGAVGFALAFRMLSYDVAFLIMGLTIITSATASLVIRIKYDTNGIWDKTILRDTKMRKSSA